MDVPHSRIRWYESGRPCEAAHSFANADSGFTMTDARQNAHQLIDRLPESELSALAGLLETIVDPLGAALRNAPMDDEPATEEEKQGVAEARVWLQRQGGRGIPHEEAMRRLGLE